MYCSATKKGNMITVQWEVPYEGPPESQGSTTHQRTITQQEALYLPNLDVFPRHIRPVVAALAEVDQDHGEARCAGVFNIERVANVVRVEEILLHSNVFHMTEQEILTRETNEDSFHRSIYTTCMKRLPLHVQEQLERYIARDSGVGAGIVYAIPDSDYKQLLEARAARKAASGG